MSEETLSKLSKFPVSADCNNQSPSVYRMDSEEYSLFLTLAIPESRNLLRSAWTGQHKPALAMGGLGAYLLPMCLRTRIPNN